MVGFNGGLEPESERDKRLSKGTSTFPLVVLPPKPRLICRFEVWGVFGNPGAAGSLAWPGAAVDAIPNVPAVPEVNDSDWFLVAI